MNVYRAIVIPLDGIDCNVERLIALTNLAYRGYLLKPPDLSATAYYELEGWKLIDSLVFGVKPKRWLADVWFPMRVRRRINGSVKGTNISPVVIDFDHGVIRLRSVCRIQLPVPKWLYDRVAEGGDVKQARLGLKDGKPYLVIVVERPYKPIETSGYTLVVDVNSWRHGAVVGLITPRGKIAIVKRFRPNLRKIDTLYGQVVTIERKLGVAKRLGFASEEKRLRKTAKRLRRKLYNYLKDFVNKAVHEIVSTALKFRAKIVVDDIVEESRRELLEEKLSNGLIKLYFVYIRRFVGLLVNQAKWHGLLVEFRRLPSTVCSMCGAELEQKEGRTMVCLRCDFRVNRDEIPIRWAVKIYSTRGEDTSRGVVESR